MVEASCMLIRRRPGPPRRAVERRVATVRFSPCLLFEGSVPVPSRLILPEGRVGVR
jgi:hypothetical protein